MNPALTVAVVGIGHIGAVHLQTAIVHENVAHVVAVDPVEPQRDLARSIGADETFASVESMLDAHHPDVTVIAVPPGAHAAIAASVISAGSAVFLEKPLARTPEEATDIVQMADQAGVPLGVDHTIRYQSDIRELKRDVDAGDLGAIPTCSMWRINNGPFSAPPAPQSGPGWQLDPTAAGGGALLDLGVHLFDVLEWFFGDLTIEYASTSNVLDLPVEDAATVVVGTETGTVATVTCGYFQWEEPPDVTSGMRVDGIADSRSSEEYRPRTFYGHAAESALKNVVKTVTGQQPAYFEPTYYYRAHYRALTEFIDAVLQGHEPPVSGRDGARMIDLVYDAYELADHQSPALEVTHD